MSARTCPGITHVDVYSPRPPVLTSPDRVSYPDVLAMQAFVDAARGSRRTYSPELRVWDGTPVVYQRRGDGEALLGVQTAVALGVVTQEWLDAAFADLYSQEAPHDR